MEKAQNTDNTKAKWTVMAYMAGDNNLDGAALRDIDEMAKVGSTKDMNCLVQLDRIEDKLTRRFRITRGGGFEKDCIEKFGDTNTGDPQGQSLGVSRAMLFDPEENIQAGIIYLKRQYDRFPEITDPVSGPSRCSESQPGMACPQATWLGSASS